MMEVNEQKDKEDIAVELLLLNTTIQLASRYMIAEDTETKIDLNTALNILSISTNMRREQAIRMMHIARRIAKV